MIDPWWIYHLWYLDGSMVDLWYRIRNRSKMDSSFHNESMMDPWYCKGFIMAPWYRNGFLMDPWYRDWSMMVLRQWNCLHSQPPHYHTFVFVVNCLLYLPERWNVYKPTHYGEVRTSNLCECCIDGFLNLLVTRNRLYGVPLRLCKWIWVQLKLHWSQMHLDSHLPNDFIILLCSFRSGCQRSAVSAAAATVID